LYIWLACLSGWFFGTPFSTLDTLERINTHAHSLSMGTDGGIVGLRCIWLARSFSWNIKS
jgi:hypothetical protein